MIGVWGQRHVGVAVLRRHIAPVDPLGEAAVRQVVDEPKEAAAQFLALLDGVRQPLRLFHSCLREPVRRDRALILGSLRVDLDEASDREVMGEAGDLVGEVWVAGVQVEVIDDLLLAERTLGVLHGRGVSRDKVLALQVVHACSLSSVTVAILHWRGSISHTTQAPDFDRLRSYPTRTPQTADLGRLRATQRPIRASSAPFLSTQQAPGGHGEHERGRPDPRREDGSHEEVSQELHQDHILGCYPLLPGLLERSFLDTATHPAPEG